MENLPGNIWPIDGPKSLNVFLDNHQMSLPWVCPRQARLRRGVLPSGGTGGRLPAEQRRSQVSLAGGADRIPGGDKPQYLYYSYGKRQSDSAA